MVQNHAEIAVLAAQHPGLLQAPGQARWLGQVGVGVLPHTVVDIPAAGIHAEPEDGNCI